MESSTNNDRSIKLLERRKCADLEQQLHQTLNELSSAQLFIELFNKEHKQDSVDMSVSQQVSTDLECTWKCNVTIIEVLSTSGIVYELSRFSQKGRNYLG